MEWTQRKFTLNTEYRQNYTVTGVARRPAGINQSAAIKISVLAIIYAEKIIWLQVKH